MEKKRNLWLLPTDKPSRLVIDTTENKLDYQPILHNKTVNVLTQHIYITFDEEIKEGDWVLIIDDFETYIHEHKGDNLPTTYCKKIILTTNQDLINDGVQVIDDEFLEWYIKNPSCEWVETFIDTMGCTLENCDANPCINYKIIISKEPKQETLEEAAAKHFNKEIFVKGVTIQYALQEAFIIGAKWQAKKMEKQEMATNCNNVILDEEITKLANEHILYNSSKRQWVIEGMKLYREKLKQ